jgi:hypothetical protein
MTGDSWNEGIRIEGRPEPPAKEDTGASWARVMPGFFEAIGAKVLLGRPITDGDTAATRKVAVVNQAFVRKFFKGQNPIGQHFGIDKIKYSATVRNRRRYERHALSDLRVQETRAPYVLGAGSTNRAVRRSGLPER